MLSFYDKYIKHSNPNFLIITGKLINITYKTFKTTDKDL